MSVKLHCGGKEEILMKSKKCTLGLLIFYLTALSWIIIFKLQFSIADLPHLRNINLIPFAESVIVNGTVHFDWSGPFNIMYRYVAVS